MKMKVVNLLAVAASVCAAERACAACAVEADIVIYGSSPAAITAAVQAKRMGRSAVVVSPETRIGGLTTGGLGATDIGNKSAFGGLALQFYKDVADYYKNAANWKYETPSDWIRATRPGDVPDGQDLASLGEDSMWTFEPHAALDILERWERENKLKIFRGEFLDREKGVRKDQGRIASISTLSGKTFLGRMFVDATYEGDLMAAAGVSYTVGREANSAYGETISGVERGLAKYHQFNKSVSAYVKPGDPSSGLLPFVAPDTDAPDGAGDRRVQAYCFRMCLTDDPSNRIPFMKPDGYDPLDYELLLRNFETIDPKEFADGDGWKAYMPWINSRMPNRKTDTNNRTGFSTDFIGQNWAWPEATYGEREKMLKAHLKYQMGLMWTLANHPRVPEPIRREVARWGTCKDEFTDGLGLGWQSQLYVREGRRMVGEYVATEHDVLRRRKVARPIAMAAYGMDSHHVRRYVDADGFVRNEGDIQDWRAGGKPYPLDYGVIIPNKSECKNLLVPVCVSASHMAFGSIRMEPVFFALGQAAGAAASLSIDADCAVQDLDYARLREVLVSEGQVIDAELTSVSAKHMAGETIELAAKPTVTPVELNVGDTLKFTLLDGRTRTIRAVDTSARIVETPVVEGHVFMFDVTLEVDGHKVKIDRYTGTQQAFYEPLVVNGMRIWTDMALSVFDKIPMRYPGEGNLRQRPWKEVRLALQDATIEDCPVKLSKWFDYRHPSIYVGDCYHGSDCWMGSFGEGATHGGLDINQKKGEPLYAPMDFDGGGYFNSLAMGHINNRWRGWRKWPDGSIWALQVHHVITQRVERGEKICQGMHLFDGAGVSVGGVNHNHYELKISNGKMPDWDAGSRNDQDGSGKRALETGQPEVYHLDPWIYFRQIFRNEREKTGYVYPEMSPVGPAKTGEAVKFSLTKGGSSDVYWDFGDGAFSHGAAVLHRYAKSGIYAARAVVVRHDGTMDEVVRHLTVDGPPTAAPSPVVESDDCGFDHWKAGVQYPFGFHTVDCRPGVIVFEAAGASHGAGSESRTLRICNAGAGRLPPIAVSLPSACGWLCLKTAMDELTLTIDPSKAAFGTNETVVVLRCEGSLNGDVEIPVCLIKSRSGANGGDFVMDIGSRGFYATPGFWCSQRFRGSNRRYLSSGFRPEADAFARFTPGPMEEGTYRVRVCADTPWALGSSCAVNVRGSEGIRRVRFDPAKSWTVGDFRFASGSGNYVEFLAKDCVGSVVVNSLSFERLREDAADPSQPHGPEALDIKASPTLTPVEMNVGDTVLFTLFNGEKRSLKLVDTSASVAASTAIETVYAFSMTLEIDGESVTLERSTSCLDACYEPFVVNGVRIWPDSVLKLFDVVPARSPSEGSLGKRPRKDARLALQDGTSEDCPEKLLEWFRVADCAPEGCHLDPWIYFRQISRNERERTGCEYPEMAPVGPAKVLERVDFELTSGACPDAVEVYWDFGDGTFARGTKASHRYCKRGVYAAHAVVMHKNGTKDELVRHLTVSGTDAASPSLCVTADEPSFFPRPAGSPQSFAATGEIYTPGVMTFKIEEEWPHVESRELFFVNIGGGELPDLSVRLASPCDWLTFSRTARGVLLTMDGTKVRKGVSESVLVVSGNGLLNGSAEVPVKVEVGKSPWGDGGSRNFYAFDKEFPSMFYATPGGWYRLVGYNFGRLSTICTSGARNRAGEEARFIPWIPKPGMYEVTVPLDAPMAPGYSCNVRIRGAHGVKSLRFEPGKSMSLGVHEFSAGTGNYISFESAGTSGEVVVRKIRMTMTDKAKTNK